MFSSSGSAQQVSTLPGVARATLVFGARTLLTEFHLTARHALPRHSHPHEQTGYLVRGRLALTIGSETFDAHPGDSWCIPGGVEHGAEILEDCVAIEVFAPVRQDYLPEG